MSEADIVSALLTDKKELLKRVVEKASKVMRIDRETGETILTLPRKRFSESHLVAIYLLGNYLASKTNRRDVKALGAAELSRLTGFDNETVSLKLAELQKEGLIDPSNEGEYSIADHSLETLVGMMEEIDHGISKGENLSSESPTPVKPDATLTRIDFTSVTDTDAVVLSLNDSKAFPSSQFWISADDIFRWTSEHGSFVREETLKKYTLPQDPVLKRLIVSRRIGIHRQYQLSRLGFERARKLLSGTVAKQEKN